MIILLLFRQDENFQMGPVGRDLLRSWPELHPSSANEFIQPTIDQNDRICINFCVQTFSAPLSD
jgi:hypothetical protein